MLLIGALLAVPAAALGVPQHELLISVSFDGTEDFSEADPLDDGAGGHTPGLDLNANNGVLRTYDQIGYKLNWNVNEADATAVTVKATLPEGMTWMSDPTTATGTPAGCTEDGTSSIAGNGGRDLVCVIVGDQPEGSNGRISARALLGGVLDGVDLALSGTIESAENPTPAASNQVVTKSSAVPNGNWVKGAEVVDAGSGAVIGYAPNEVVEGVVDPDTGATGSLFIWSLHLRPEGGRKGSEPINDTVPIQFWDHWFDSFPSGKLASAAMMPVNAAGVQRVPCGGYDGAGSYPFGQTAGVASSTPANQTNAGVWSCTDLGSTANGYPLVQIDISGHDTQNFAPLNADLTPNTDTLISGQIAFWASDTDMAAKSPQVLQNAITGSAAAIGQGTVEVDAIQIAGHSGLVDEYEFNDASAVGLAGVTNTSPYDFVAAPSGGGGGQADLRHSVTYVPGPYAEVEYPDMFGKTYRWYDHRMTNWGGPGNVVTDGTTVNANADHSRWDGNGQTPRGNVLTVLAGVTAFSGADRNDPVHMCLAIDTTHQEVIALPSSYPLYELGDFPVANNNSLSYIIRRQTLGVSQASPVSPLASVYAGTQGSTFAGFTVNTGGVVVDRPPLNYTLEYASAVSPAGSSSTKNGVTCNGGDADGRGWVDGTTGDLSVFQTGTAPDGSALYGDINLVRVRTEGDVFWGSAENNHGASIMLAMQVRVKDDVAAQAAGQELFVYAARSNGVWDGSGQPAGDRCSGPVFGPEEPSLTGWCNVEFTDDGASSTDLTDIPNNAPAAVENLLSGSVFNNHADKVYIVEAQLAISKENTAGDEVQVYNGMVTEFAVNPSVIGSSLDKVDQVVVTDRLPATMAFVGFTQQPSVGSCVYTGGTHVVSPIDPTQTVLVNGLITCTYPDDLTGGWGNANEGAFAFEVMIVGAPADRALTNEAEVNGVDDITGEAKTPATDKALVFTGASFEESLVVKALNDDLGPCVSYPAGPVDAAELDPQPANWVERCELIDFEDAPASMTSAMSFQLELVNQGNMPLTNVRFVDVFPHNADEVETISNTVVDGVPVPTLGDGRSPETDTTGSVGLVSVTGDDVVSYWVTGDDPSTISRDPDHALANTVWCDAPAGATQTAVAGTCPATAEDVTAVYIVMSDIPIGGKLSATLALSTTNHECDDIWTNTFGGRTDEIELPIRSNDVSIMVNCEYDLALRKVVDPTWAPGANWLTQGSSTVDFVIEMINQGDPINTFDLTDYVDTSVFNFDPANNPAGTTTDAKALPFSWDATGTNPVVTVNGATEAGHNPSLNAVINGDIIQVPVTLTVSPDYVVAGAMSNKAEISYFDNDANPDNGNSNTTLTDLDSTPDGTDDDPLTDDITDNSSGDEDDHDIASIPVFDVELDKARPTVVQTGTGSFMVSYDITVLNNSNVPVYNVEVLETPPTGVAYAHNQDLETGSETTGAGLTATGGETTEVTAADPVYTVTNLNPGSSITWTVSYDITDVTAGPFVNSAQVTAWADNADGTSSTYAVDADSTPNNDTDHTASNEDDDDSEQATLPFDLALVKKPIVDNPDYPDILDGVHDGDQILFGIEVFNQLAQVEDFDVIDYITAGWRFDEAAQPATLETAAGSGGGPVLPFTWTSQDGNAVAQVEGVLPSGDSTIIPIVLTVDLSAGPSGQLANYAEILRFDDDGDPTNGDSSDGTLSDLDSTPDGDNTDALIDDEYNDDGTTDEDDHDVAFTVWYDVAIEKMIYDGTDCVEGPADITVATESVEYCITVTNEGPTTLYGVGFADTPPAGLTFNSTTLLADGVTDQGNGAYEIDQLVSGASVTVRLDYSFDIAAATGPNLTNVAEVTSMFSDPERTSAAADVDSFVDDTPDGDEPTEDDEDSQTTRIPFDLALTKTLGPINGSLVTMYLTVVNQSIPVEQVELTDYIDTTMWKEFNPILNPYASVEASSTATAMFAYEWDATDPVNPVAKIAPMVLGDKLAYGETVVVPITLEIADGWTGPALSNFAEISNFDDDGDATNGNGADGTLIDADSTPDGEHGNGLGESANYLDDATDGDGTSGGDEDDHDGVQIPIYDLALRKTVDPATVAPVAPGDPATFLIEVINQGNTHATGITLIDYVDLTMFQAFDPALGANAGGTTTGDQALAYAWTADGTNGALTLTGSLAPGEVVIVPVTLAVAWNPIGDSLENKAEISGGTATNAAGEAITDGAGNPLTDRDSTPDTTDDDNLTDDVVDNGSGDEDDHDIAVISPAGPGIDIEKDTNGVQSDEAPGETLGVGDAVTWNYVVTNTGSVTLVEVTVTDSEGEAVDCDAGDAISNVIPVLFVGESATCTAEGFAVEGPYSNTAAVTGVPGYPDPAGGGGYLPVEGAQAVTDEDMSHYQGVPLQFDLALQKRLVTDPATITEVPTDVVFEIEVFNQGTATAVDVEVVDHPPAQLVLNDPNWTANADGSATTIVPGPIAAGESAVVTITMTLADYGDVVNLAGIEAATPVHPVTGNVLDLTDVDSTTGNSLDDPLVDDVLDNADGDEDDSDVAGINVQRPLAFTGTSTGTLTLIAGSFLLVGFALALFSLRRRTRAAG